MEGPIAITDCADPESTRDCMIKNDCPCESNWKRINDAVRNALDAVRLADMNGGCRIPFSGLPQPEQDGDGSPGNEEPTA